MPHAQVRSVGFMVPDRVVTNQDLSQVMDTSDEWIQERTGIRERRLVASPGPGTSDLGVNAAKQALERGGVDPKELDLIVAATLSPDFYFPGIGVQIQDKLGTTAPGIDLRGQCSGFSWGISTADAFVRAGSYRKVLVVGAEIHSRVIEFSNRGRNVSVLFGDGAGAALIEAVDGEERPTAQNEVRGVIDSLMGTDGSGADYLAIKRPGSGGPEEFLTPAEAEGKAYLPIMDGRQVFRNAVTRMIATAETLLERNGIDANALNLVVPHQANLRINEMVRQKLGVSPDRVFNNIERYGNTTAATLPICLTEAEDQGKLKKGDLVLLLAFGSGFTWGGNLLRW